MKKLMIAAAAAAMIGGAFAEQCGDAEGCLVYDLKVTLKTLGYKSLKCKATCGDATVEYLDTVTRSLKGYAWSCDYDCMCDGSGKTELEMALWEPKASLGWWLYDVAGAAADVKWDMGKETMRYAKNGSKCAINMFNTADIEGTDWSTACDQSTFKQVSNLNFGGVGGSVAYQKSVGDCIIKSISGYVIGEVTADVRCSKYSSSTTKSTWCADPVTTVTCCADKDPLWACLCNCDPQWCDGADGTYIIALSAGKDNFKANMVPAVGTWSMKFNSSLANGKKSLTDKLPTYATK